MRETGRNTQGVQFATPGKGDSIVAVARNAEKDSEEIDDDAVVSETNEAAESTQDATHAPDDESASTENNESGDSE